MSNFNIYVLRVDEVSVSFASFLAEDDQVAIKLAIELLQIPEGQLWEGRRFVCVCRRESAPAVSIDRLRSGGDRGA
jgi:hypothetical protein